jgi:hypothetical protein
LLNTFHEFDECPPQKLIVNTSFVKSLFSTEIMDHIFNNKVKAVALHGQHVIGTLVHGKLVARAACFSKVYK